jgi:hypothetical protein
MAFVVALTILLCVLVASLLVTNSHLLARVVRLEREVARLGLTLPTGAEPIAEFPLAPLAPELASADGDVVVVSASCASCAAVLDRVCRDVGAVTAVVVASDADAAMVDGACPAPVVVSSPIVRHLLGAGYRLPVLLSVRDGRVTDVVPGAMREGSLS